MSVSEKAPPQRLSALASIGIVATLAIFLGVFVLPRFGTGLEGKPAPDFALSVVHGGEPGARIKLSEQRGRFVLLDFWATWCAPCRAEARVIEAIRKKHQDLVVIGVNVSDTKEAAARYLESTKPSWVVVEDTEGAANSAYRVDTLPTLVAIDREGKIFAIRRRFVSERELSALIEAMSGG
jgi:thiol-disulfide isomerase/thioredoxin